MKYRGVYSNCLQLAFPEFFHAYYAILIKAQVRVRNSISSSAPERSSLLRLKLKTRVPSAGAVFLLLSPQDIAAGMQYRHDFDCVRQNAIHDQAVVVQNDASGASE